LLILLVWELDFKFASAFLFELGKFASVYTLILSVLGCSGGVLVVRGGESITGTTHLVLFAAVTVV
jgi:hypothetical protein